MKHFSTTRHEMFVGGGSRPFKKLKRIIISTLIICTVLSGCSGKERATLPFGDSDYSGMKYEEILSQLEEAGFTNIISNKDSTTSKEQDGIIESIAVDGKTSFLKGKKDKDIPIELTYFELDQFEAIISISSKEERAGKPQFTISTNLPDKTSLVLSLTNEDGYEKEQYVEVDKNQVVCGDFVEADEKPLVGEYLLTALMDPEEQTEEVLGQLGKTGECLVGDCVKEDDEAGKKVIFTEYRYLSTYKELEPLNVEMDIVVKGEENKPLFEIGTNLPDGTILNVELSGDTSDYSEQYSLTVKDGKAITEEFTDQGNPLGGRYTFSVSMLPSDEQPDSIGREGENLTGDYTSENGSYKFIHTSVEYDAISIPMDEIIAQLEETLSQGFGNNYNVTQDDAGITINVWGDGIAETTVYAKLGVETAVNSWNDLTDSVRLATLNIRKMLSNAGYGDEICLMNIVNNVNHDNVLLQVANGVVYYDCVID